MSLLDIFRRRAHERDMDAEMRFHVDMEAADLERTGLSPADARRQALAKFGGMQRYKEEGHESRGGTWLDDLVRDLRYSARSLLHSRGYAFVVVGTLALGIAANASIFSVANAILFKPLPYRDPSKLMSIRDDMQMFNSPESWVTGPEVARMRSELESFEAFAVVRGSSATIGASEGAEPQQVPLSSVSANFFQLLGATPEIGRAFTTGEDAPGAPRVAVISHRLWTQRFGGDREVIGKSIYIDGNATSVIGVLPSTFQYSMENSLGAATNVPDVYLTFPDTFARMPVNLHNLGVLARVRADVPTRVAIDELKQLGSKLNDEVYGKRNFGFNPLMLEEVMVREVRPALLVLLAAVGMLMLIMCANLAVLALVRAARREREITVRRAIGASQSRVSRQILTETVLLSLAGALVGSVLGTWALRLLLAISPPGLPRRTEIGIDLVVLAVTLALALLVGIGMGLAPVVHSLRSDISSVLREKAPSYAGSRVRRALVLAQVALSLILLAGTGLLLGSFLRIMRVDMGFDPHQVLTVQLMPPRAKYATGRPVQDVIERYAAALRALPGVVEVGATSAPPLSGQTNQDGFFMPGSPTNTGDNEKDRMLVDEAAITPGYLKAMGISLLEGQDFDASHADSLTRRVTILDDLLAKRYFPNGSAVGQYAIVNGDSLRVIGVARHVRIWNVQDAGREQLWLPHSYAPYRFMVLAVRTRVDPMSLAAAARQAIRDVDPDQPILTIGSMTEAVSGALAERRLVLTLVGAFAAAALLLAALGIYGVTSSTVNQRTRELGIRMALGANRRSVVWSVLSEPTKLVAFGLVIGLAGTFAAGRAVERLLYGIRPTDPVTLGIVALILLAIAILASYVPARRATRVDPVVALRAD
jgi:predicted permease